MSRKEKIRSEALEFNIKKFLECTKEIKNFNELNRAWAWYVLFIIKNENLMADEKGCNSMLYIEESSFI